MSFYLIIWKEFENRKMVLKSEIVQTDNPIDAIWKLQAMNNSRRLTTTDYENINLSAKFEEQSLEIVSITQS